MVAALLAGLTGVWVSSISFLGAEVLVGAEVSAVTAEGVVSQSILNTDGLNESGLPGIGEETNGEESNLEDSDEAGAQTGEEIFEEGRETGAFGTQTTETGATETEPAGPESAETGATETESESVEPDDVEPDDVVPRDPDGEWVVRPYDPLRSPTACPADIETLSALLIRDIPNYTNRVLQRSVAVIPDYEGADDTEINTGFGDTESSSLSGSSSGSSSGSLLERSPYRPAFVLVAGNPDLEPLDLNEYAFTTDPAEGGPLTQLFFTTLARQYSGNRHNDVQSYHWVFLAEAEDGWWLAFMFSQIDDAETLRAPTPPRESSSGSVGQAVQLWLRDCRAGAIYPLDVE